MPTWSRPASPRPRPMRCCGRRWRPARRRRCAWSRPDGWRARARSAWSVASRNRPPRSPRPSASTTGCRTWCCAATWLPTGAPARFPRSWRRRWARRRPWDAFGWSPVDGRALRVYRRLDGGRREVLMVRPPAVVSIEAAGVRAAAGRAARHPGQAERRDHGGQHAGGRGGAADQGPRRPPVPAAAARASRADRHRAAPDAGADRGARPAHPADRGRPAARGAGRWRTAGLPAPMRLPGRWRPRVITGLGDEPPISQHGG